MASSSAPTIVRTEHKFGDYLSKPDLARFELPRKTSRPLIVNKTYGKENIEKNRESGESVELRNVFPKMKQNKYERRKMVGTNKKDVRNINDIIESDKFSQMDTTQPSTTEMSKVSDDQTTQWTSHQNTNVPPKTSDMNPYDAMDKFHREPRKEMQPNRHQENDEEMEEKMRSLERDIELEQQQMMNRLYNNPSTFDSSFVSVGLMPVMVHNPAGGYYIVNLPIHPTPPPPPPPPPHYLPDSIYSTSSCYPVSHSSTSSSISSSDEGFVDDNESNDDAVSLVESLEDKLEISEEESDEDDELNRLDIEKDEELNRLVSSIIDDDD